MTIQIPFDVAHNPEMPTILLAKKNGDIIGQLDSKSIEVSGHLKNASEISFIVYKSIDGELTPWWEQITNFKLIHCIEWDMWFEIKVDIDEATETIKTVMCTQLGHAELSQIMVYSTQINTEEDIAREDYALPTIFYDPEHPEASLLHRVLEKAPHYSITYVDSSLMKLQRTFTFDGKSIYDSLQEIATEINCLFVFPSRSDENGRPMRTIEVYDLETVCLDCNYRGEFENICPKCNSGNLNNGYGEDTTIFVTADELGEEIKLTSDVDSVKNCFKLEAGDDLMTATIRNCNPNGTDYLWFISDSMKQDMSTALSEKLSEYDALFQYYNNNHVANISLDTLIQYNTLVDKYKVFNEKLEHVSTPITGFPALIHAYYNTIDFSLFLQSTLMPDASMMDTNAENEAGKLIVDNLSPVAVADIDSITLSSANNAVLSMAKVIVDSRYKVKIQESSLDTSDNVNIWTGCFSIENFSDEEDCAISNSISIEVNGDYEIFVKQKIDKTLNNENVEDLSISGLFKKELKDFTTELTKYSLNYLKIFLDSCQGCLDILIEQGVTAESSEDLYNNLYIPYFNKLQAIENEIKIRESEINSIIGVYNTDGDLITSGLQNIINTIIQEVQLALDFQGYLGETLWLEFCTFRRDDKYSNNNYISDGLNNAELISNANDFIQVANKEIRKAAEIQHTISTSLKNLLAIKKFKPLVNYFKVGNWIRVQIDDEIYKLRLMKYEINFDSLDNISVEFSDAINIRTSLNTIQTAIDNAQTMATSYESVKRQAKLGANSDRTLTDIIEGGLSMSTVSLVNNATNQNQSWNERGMLFRTYDPIEEDYSDEQLKIINSTIAMTDDKWKNTKTAVGKFFYYDPVTNKMKQAWGINGELLVGKMLLGESFGIYNKDGTLTFDDRGFIITNDINTVSINPNNTSIFTIKNTNEELFTFDTNGDIVIVGNITAKSLTLSEGTTIGADKIDGLSVVATSGKYTDLLNIPEFHEVAYSGEYEDLENKPVLATVATTGQYSDLLGIPDFHDVAYSGSYYDLENIPTFAAVAYSGKFEDLIDAPVLATVATTGQYEDLDGLPDLSQIDVNKATSEANKKNIDSLSENVNSNFNDILTLQSDVEQIKSNIETLNSNVSTNTTNIGTLQEEINTLKKELESLKNSSSETI